MKYSEPHIRTTIRLPPALYRRLVQAAANGKVASIQAAVLEGCEGLLNWIEKQDRRKKK